MLDNYPLDCVVNDDEICSVCDQEILTTLYYRPDEMLRDEGEIETIDEEIDTRLPTLPERTGWMHIE